MHAIRVASIPPAHVYVAHLAAPGGGDVVYLPHPLPEGAPNRYGTCWPPVPIPVDWFRDADYDVLHVQFDFDVYTLAELRQIIGHVHRRRIPLVFTVHDLCTTTAERQDEHDRRVDLLVTEADALLTLTPGAAAAIRDRWGRPAGVVPHPHVVPLDVMARSAAVRRRRPASAEWRIGVHLRWMRANMDVSVVPVLAETVRRLPAAALDVYIHRDVLEQSTDPGFTAYLRRAAAAGHLRLHPHEEMTDPQLWESLGALDATVLPYRFGSHSGWLEACRDLGTTVLAPRCGYYAEQGPTLTYALSEGKADPASLRAAVRVAEAERPCFAATVAERSAQRRQIAAAHESLYRSLLSGAAPSAATPPTRASAGSAVAAQRDGRPRSRR